MPERTGHYTRPREEGKFFFARPPGFFPRLHRRNRTKKGAVWRFDPRTRSWSLIETHGEEVPPPPGNDYGGLAWDAKRNRLLMFAGSRKRESGCRGVWSCDPVEGTVKKLTPKNPQAGPSQPRECVYLPGGDIVLFALTRHKAAVVFDAAACRFRLLKIKNPLGKKQHGYGLMYDPKRDLAWVVSCNAGGGWPIHVMRFDPATAEFMDP